MYPLLWLSGAFLAGILLASRLHLPWQAWTGLAAACLLLSLAERRVLLRFSGAAGWLRVCPLPALLLTGCLLLGGARWQAAHPAVSAADAVWYVGRGAVTLRGWVSDPPQPDQGTPLFRVSVESLRMDGAPEELPVRGIVQVKLPGAAALEYGSRVELRGQLERPPDLEDFSYRAHLARQNVHALLGNASHLQVAGQMPGSGLLRALNRLRRNAYRVINASLPQPEAALVNGILLGLDGNLPPALVEAFQVSGTAHIIAISGFNIALLAGLFMGLFGRLLPRWWALLVTLLALTAYTLLVGAEPAVVRAAIMGSLALAGRELGRRSSGLNALVFAAALMCLGNPNLLWDAAFQLSFMATLGLVLFADPLQCGFQHLAGRVFSSARAERLTGFVGEYVLVTLAAQITTLPVIAAHFGRVSWVALISNPLVLPAQPALMILAGLAAIAGLIWLPLGKALSMLVWPLAAYTNRLAGWFGSIPGAAVEMELGNSVWVWLYLAAIFALRWKSARKVIRRQMKPAVLLAGLGLLAALTTALALRRPDGNLHLTVLNDRSQSALLRFPGGETLMIVGAKTTALPDEFQRCLPLFSRRLDGLILPEKQAITSVIPLLEQLTPRMTAATNTGWASEAGIDAENALILAGSQAVTLAEGQVWRSAQGARVEVLAASGESAALLVEWGRFRAVLPGTFTLDELGADHAQMLNASVLVLRDANGAGWSALNPQSILWVGNSAPEEEARVIRVSAGGWAEARADEKRMWIATGDD